MVSPVWPTPMPCAPLLDHLIRQNEERRGEHDPKRLRRLAVEDQLEPHGPHDRQIGWLDPLENATRVDAGLLIPVHDAATIAHEAASSNEFPEIVDHWQRMVRRECYTPIALAGKTVHAADDRRVVHQ